MSLSSFKKFQDDSERRLEQDIFKRMAQRLSTVIDLGIPLGAYQGLRDEVETLAASARAVYVVVVDPNGKVLAGQRPEEALSLWLPLGVMESKEEFTFRDFGLLWVGWPIQGSDGKIEGFICQSLAADLGDHSLELAQRAVSPWTLLTLLLSILLTGGALVTGARKYARGRIGIKNFYVRIVASFLVGQALFSAWSMSSLFDYHLNLSRTMAGQLLNEFAQDLDNVTSKGLKLSQIADLKRYMESLLPNLPVIESLSVKDGDFELHTSGAPDPNKVPEDMKVSEIFSRGNSVSAILSDEAIKSVRIDLTLDNLFLTLVSCLFLFELIGLLIADLRKMATSEIEFAKKPDVILAKEPPQGLGPLRPLTFVALLAMDLSLSFIPLAMAAMNPSGTLVPVAVLLGLPVSIQMAMTGVAMVFGGRLAHRLKKIRPLMVGGFVLAALGSLGGALAWEPWLFTVSMGIVGLGYGTFNLAAHLYATEKSPPGQSGEAMGELAAGMFSGSLCGCLIGGMLADRFGYAPVFSLAMVIFLLMAVVWPIMLTPSDKAQEKASAKKPGELDPLDEAREAEAIGPADPAREAGTTGPADPAREAGATGPADAATVPAEAQKPKGLLSRHGDDGALKEKKGKKDGGSVRSFLTNRGVLNLFFLSVLPTSVALIGLFNYFLPVHLASMGYGPAMVSRLNVLMSLTIILLGPKFGRDVDKSSRQPAWLFVAGILAALAIPTYLVWPTLAGVVLGVGLLSLSTCVTESGHAAYLLNLKATKGVGADQALGLYSGFSRASRMFGPVILGATYGGWGLPGLILLGAMVAAASLAFWILAEVPVRSAVGPDG
ncbi:MAG: MFS transporter [Deltaproteobacteria bacterium]|nr:MFS transporter [Deltaproteobacteria bacterium]